MILRSWCVQCSLDGAVQIRARIGSVADKTLHELALAIEDECLWNRVLAGKQESYKVFIGLRERILNAELFGEGRHFLFVAWSTDVETNNTKALVLVLLLQSDQVRNAVATGATPRGVEIQYQDLAFVLGENGALTVGEFPAHVGE